VSPGTNRPPAAIGLQACYNWLQVPDRTYIPGVIPSEEVIRQIRARQAVTLLAFSGGKDAIASWLVLRDHFDDVEPVFMYTVPELEFVEVSLRYYEQFFGKRIRRFPHPSFYRMLRNLVFQPPEHCAAIEAMEGKSRLFLDYDYNIQNAQALADAGMPVTTYCANGVRAADSIMRRMNFQRNGPITDSRRAFYPIWDWTKEALIKRLAAAKIKVPIDYRLFGRSLDGIDYRFLGPIRTHFPADYKKILEWFPLAEAELFRFEQMGGKRKR
jgi:hypothetical protein